MEEDAAECGAYVCNGITCWCVVFGDVVWFGLACVVLQVGEVECALLS